MKFLLLLLFTVVFGSKCGDKPSMVKHGEEICCKKDTSGSIIEKAVGAAAIGGATYAAVTAASWLVGLGPLGPIVGGLFAANQGAALVAGGWMAFA